jgi:hypothetical protein
MKTQRMGRPRQDIMPRPRPRAALRIPESHMSVRTCRNRRLPAFRRRSANRSGVGTLLVHAQGDKLVAYGDHALHAAIRQ